MTSLLRRVTPFICILSHNTHFLPFQFGVAKIKMSSSSPSGVKYLSQKEAIRIDEELFSTYKFSVDQLMELAGLSVATAVYRAYFSSHAEKSVVAIAGPGNNGGDAMVAVRHLKLFGFHDVTLLATRKPQKELFLNLLHQAEQSGVKISYDPQPFLTTTTPPSLLIDGLFGFSFKPPVRPDYQPFMDLLTKSGDAPVASIDIPSGWDVESGPPGEGSFMPHTLISLTAPKKSASFFTGQNHFLGGRFVPPELAEKYELNLPKYPSTDSVIILKQ